MAQVVGYSRSSKTNAFYTADTVGGVVADMGGGWPFLHSAGVDVVMAVGQLISVHASFWARSGDPDIRIGHYAGVPAKFVDETGLWTPMIARRSGDFWSKSWYRLVDAAMVAYKYVDIAVLQSTINTTSPGTDGGELYVVGWETGPTQLNDVYGGGSSGTIHTPGTGSVETLNFYVGGGGYASSGADRNALVVPYNYPTGGIGTDRGFSQVLNDNRRQSDFFDEYFGVSIYQPYGGAQVGHWETVAVQSALIYGVSAGTPSVVNVGGILSGVVPRDIPVFGRAL